MSHMVKVENVQFANLRLLRNAVQALNQKGIICHLVEDADARFYGSDYKKYPLVLKLNDGQYDVGFEFKDGKYIPVFDTFYNHVKRFLGCENSTSSARGAHIKKLVDEYTKQVALEQARSMGASVSFREDNKGKLVIEIVR